MLGTTLIDLGLAAGLALFGSSSVVADTAAHDGGASVQLVSAKAEMGPCAPCDPCAPAPCEYVEKTVLVPRIVRETRTVQVTKYRAEQQERTYTVSRCVPHTETVTETCTVMVPEWQTEVVPCTVRKLVKTPVEKTFMVNTTEYQEREGTRRVCRYEPVTVERTVCVDEGHWEERACPSPCGGCAPCGGCGHCGGCSPCAPAPCARTVRVWVPNYVQKTVPCTTYRQVWEDVPCTYKVAVCVPKEVTRTVMQCEYVTETVDREVRRCVWKPEQREYTRNVCHVEVVQEEKTVTCNVMVPYTVEEEVEVCVCRMVEETVQVPVCAATACADSCCAPRRRCGRRCR